MRFHHGKSEPPIHQPHHPPDPDDYPAVEYLDIPPMDPDTAAPPHSHVQATPPSGRSDSEAPHDPGNGDLRDETNDERHR
jgi:hypothetical protein